MVGVQVASGTFSLSSRLRRQRGDAVLLFYQWEEPFGVEIPRMLNVSTISRHMVRIVG